MGQASAAGVLQLLVVQSAKSFAPALAMVC